MQHQKIWFDVTTIRKLRSHSPVGLTRVEVNVVRGAMRLPQEIVGFCYFDRYRTQFVEVDRDTVHIWLDRYGRAGKTRAGSTRTTRHRLIRYIGGVERNLRKVGRHAMGQVVRTLGVSRRFPDCKQGDVFVISGASWDSINASTLEEIVASKRLRLVTVIADMIPVMYPHHFQELQAIDDFAKFAACAARCSSLVLSISEATRQDFESFAAANDIQVHNSQVIYLGAELPSAVADRPEGIVESLMGKDFVLSVGSIQVRKNHQLLYQLWRRFAEESRNDMPLLVLVGSPGWMTRDLQLQLTDDPMIRDSIIVLNHVDDVQLGWLYEKCKFTLYPSFYEGWGLPIVESLHHLKPCIASNTSSMPEASQGLALHLDPLDFRQWYEAILRWTSDENVLNHETERIRSRLQYRSWEAFGNDFCSRIATMANEHVLERAA